MSQSQHTTRDNGSANVSGTSVHGTRSFTGSGHNCESSDVSDGGAGDKCGKTVARMVMVARMVIKWYR